jgi:hypothetical protein
MKIRILAAASRDLIDGYRLYEVQAEALRIKANNGPRARP